MRLGIAKSEMIRPRAGVSFALAEAMDEGRDRRPTSWPPLTKSGTPESGLRLKAYREGIRIGIAHKRR
jgi:hypothetical protein